MSPSSLAIIGDRHFYLSGTVTIDPSAVIAPGVLLQADPGCQLVIGAGSCIGSGSLLHAHQGTLVIEAGAILGSRVLVVGKGAIGAGSCIGAQSTLINPTIGANQVVPPSSLLGDQSRSVVLVEASELLTPPAPNPTGAEHPTASESSRTAAASTDAPPAPGENGQSAAPASGLGSSSPSQQAPDTNGSANPAVKVVYGRAYLERMMLTMFPHQRSFASDSVTDLDATPESAPEAEP